MKKYNVTVNGVTYEVEVEEVASDGATTPAPVAPVAAKAAPAPKATVAGGEPVKAPMPGTIMKLNVAVGDKVKRGDVVCILEAMKMENEIFAPADGVIASVAVAKGASVTTDQVIATIKA